MTLSRVFIVIVTGLTVVSLVKIRLEKIGNYCIIFFLATGAISIYGVFDTSWNPFISFSTDSSGAYRIWEYELARSLLRDHPILGIGIPPTPFDMWAYVKNDFFFPPDLGPIGVWFDLGIFGLIFFYIGSFIASNPKVELPLQYKTPLFLVGCLMCVYGSIAAVIMYAGGATYFTLLLAYTITHNNKLTKDKTKF